MNAIAGGQARQKTFQRLQRLHAIIARLAGRRVEQHNDVARADPRRLARGLHVQREVVDAVGGGKRIHADGQRTGVRHGRKRTHRPQHGNHRHRRDNPSDEEISGHVCNGSNKTPSGLDTERRSSKTPLGNVLYLARLKMRRFHGGEIRSISNCVNYIFPIFIKRNKPN